MNSRQLIILIIIIIALVIIVGLLIIKITQTDKIFISNQPINNQISLKKENNKSMENFKIILTTIYDNYSTNSDLETGHGFSCYIQASNANILFDAGADSQTLLSNFQKLNLDPNKVNLIVLSHIHSDHIAGLAGFLKINNQVKIYLPSSFPDSVKSGYQSSGSQVIEVSESAELMDGVYSTGELGTAIIEQGLVLKSNQGNILITGCAHPGIVEMTSRIKEQFGDLYLIIGGFHLRSESDKKILSIINELKKLGVKKAAPCHCSGDRARELFKQEFGNDYIENGVGKIIEIY